MIQRFTRGYQSQKVFMIQVQSIVRIQCCIRKQRACRKINELRNLNSKTVDRTNGSHHASMDDCGGICSKLFCTSVQVSREAADCPLTRKYGEQENLLWVNWDQGGTQNLHDQDGTELSLKNLPTINKTKLFSTKIRLENKDQSQILDLSLFLEQQTDFNQD